jgi:hypothetical protein
MSPTVVRYPPAVKELPRLDRILDLLVDRGDLPAGPIARASACPGLPTALAATPAGRWLGGLAFPRPPPVPTGPGGLPGVAVLVVMEPYTGAVARVAGKPGVVTADGAAWDLAAWDLAARGGDLLARPAGAR